MDPTRSGRRSFRVEPFLGLCARGPSGERLSDAAVVGARYGLRVGFDPWISTPASPAKRLHGVMWEVTEPGQELELFAKTAGEVVGGLADESGVFKPTQQFGRWWP